MERTDPELLAAVGKHRGSALPAGSGAQYVDLGTRFNTIIEHFARVGPASPADRSGGAEPELALQRGARWVALRQLELARTHRRSCARPWCRGPGRPGRAHRGIAGRPPLPVPAGGLLAWLDAQGEQNQSRDPEREAQWLLQAHAELPDDEALADMAARH